MAEGRLSLFRMNLWNHQDAWSFGDGDSLSCEYSTRRGLWWLLHVLGSEIVVGVRRILSLMLLLLLLLLRKAEGVGKDEGGVTAGLPLVRYEEK